MVTVQQLQDKIETTLAETDNASTSDERLAAINRLAKVLPLTDAIKSIVSHNSDDDSWYEDEPWYNDPGLSGMLTIRADQLRQRVESQIRILSRVK